MAIAFPPGRSISLTTEAAASAPLVYVIATLAPSAASRLAIAAPIPREPPVTIATLPANFCLLLLLICFVLFFFWSAWEVGSAAKTRPKERFCRIDAPSNILLRSTGTTDNRQLAIMDDFFPQ